MPKPKSQIVVNVNAPAHLPKIKTILTCKPKTQAEFDAVVKACGGPCAFTYHSSTGAHADLAEGVSLILDDPFQQTYTPPPLPASIRALKDACEDKR